MTTDTMTLTDFLLARIEEDEAYVHEAVKLRERLSHAYGATGALAECEAKRRIVAEHAEKRVGAVTFDPTVELSREYMSAVFNARTGTQCARCFANGPVTAPCTTLRALALPYVDHPEFREEWR